MRIKNKALITVGQITAVIVSYLTLSLACAAPVAAEQKIGILQDQQVLENSLYGKETSKRIQTALSSKQGDIAGKEEHLQKKRDAFQRDETVLSEKERSERKQEIVKLQRDLQGLAEQYEMEMQELHQNEMQSFRKIILEELKKIAQKENLTLVMPQHLTYYYADGIDVTDKLIKAMDESYKANKK